MLAESTVFQSHRKLYLAWLVALLTALILQLFNSKGDLVLALHYMRIDWLDELFLVITRLGEYQGFLLSAVMIILIGNWRHLLTLTSATLIMVGLIYIFKYKIFQDAERPIVFFERLGILSDFRPDYHLNRKHSFPSGHTAAAFTFFFSSALSTRRFDLQAISLVLAVAVAFSRVYLMQHFVMDTVAGSILGVVLVSAIYVVMNRMIAIDSRLNRMVLKRNEKVS